MDDSLNAVQPILKKWFKEIIAGNKVDIDIQTVELVMKKGFLVNFDTLMPRLKYVLPYMFISYIKCWPGWKYNTKYCNKLITFTSWFLKFKEYLTYRVQFLISNEYENIIAMLRYHLINERTVEKSDKSTQVSFGIQNKVAPINIEISGPAKVLNTLVFYEGLNDSVHLKEFPINSDWECPLNVRQLINWPFTEVEFKSKDLHFKRTLQHQYKRYLTLSSIKDDFKKDNEVIDEIDIINENIRRQAYTLNTMRKYCNAYEKVLRAQQDVLNAKEEDLDAIETILIQFIRDIVDINKGSIATNTRIVFNLGKSIYARNKSVKTSENAICYGECITPRINLSLYSFTAIRDPNMKSFDEIFQPNDINTLLPVITYRCTFCDTSYTKTDDLFTHIQMEHLMEQPVLCYKCSLQFKILHLSNTRWFHDCEEKD